MPLLLLPRSFQVNSAGLPYGGAKLYTYRAGTTTNLTVYKDPLFAVAHTNPIVADSAGLFPAIYTNPASGFNLRLILKTSADVTIYDEDNIPAAPSDFVDVNASGDLSVVGNALIDGTTQLSGTLTQSQPTFLRYLVESDAAVDAGIWREQISGGEYSLATVTAGFGTGWNVCRAVRSPTGVSLTLVEIGDSVSLPTVKINGNLAATIVTGTFTGTLTGMTTTVTASFSYLKVGGWVSIWLTSGADVTGTSNSTALTITGAPAAIFPTAVRQAGFVLGKDNGTQKGMNAIMGTTGTLSLSLGIDASTAFTTSGTKGILGSFACGYPA